MWPAMAPRITTVNAGTWKSIGVIRLALSPAWNDPAERLGNDEREAEP